MDKNTLISKSKEIFGDKYDFSLVADNFTTKEKLSIVCPIHGAFEKSYEKHIISKQGCPKCSGKFRYDTESFINECLTKDNVENISFNEVVYVNNKTKVKMVCHCKDENGIEHGEFYIAPSHFLSGERCPKCRYVKSATKKRRDITEVIELANNIHNNKYDYSLITSYKNDREKLPIICKEHGLFYQTMNNHIKGKQGCPKCGKLKSSFEKSLTTEEFITRSNERHNNKYDYSKVEYVKSADKVKIICPTHGEFEQIARNHIFGQGCPKCFQEKSNFEKELFEYIKSILPNEVVIENDRTLLNGKEIDIYIPNLKIGFEANGLIWHSEKFNDDKNYHLNKTILCEEKSVYLIHIFEDEWANKNDICKSRILNILNKIDEKIYARKCIIKEVSYKDSVAFINENHIQGNIMSTYRYGLYYNGELVSLMTFGKPRINVNGTKDENTYELLRFCNKKNINVVGGASKLFKHFIKRHNPQKIISYADRRWSKGNLYEVLNFVKYNESPPSYSYVINKQRINRFSLRKDVLISKYGCDPKMTEKEFCNSKGWYRIYDCGCLCYKWEK